MGLEIPTLDDRAYEQLLEDAMKRLPVYTDEWTDHNVHDPGITTLEMLVWIAETYNYQLDQVTDAHRRKYLRLLDTPPRSPVPASVDLELAPPASALRIPAGEPLVADDGSGATTRFQTATSVALTDARVARLVSEHRRDRTDVTSANRTEGLSFPAFGDRATRGSVLFIGFGGDPFEGSDRLDLTVDLYDEGLPAPATHGDEAVTFDPSVRLAWQYCTDYDSWYREEAWADLAVARDETLNLYRGGTVSLERPDGWLGPATGVRILDAIDDLAWIRCVVETAGYEIPPEVDALRVNVVTATHRTRHRDEHLRRTDGGAATTARPNQTFAFEHAPVLDATVTVGGERWKRVEDFDGSSPDDPHYVVEEMAGAIRFGDGIRGRVPETGQRVIAETYVVGGGTAGNVPPSTAWAFERDPFHEVGITPRDGATGGEDAESIDAALIRSRSERETPFRVVTPDDYAAIATSTPGLRFGRATALVDRIETRGECVPAHLVRVVVVPYGTRSQPVPSEGFLQAVDDHLQQHRLLTDRVTVEAPTYVGIGVDAEVRIGDGYAAAERTAAIEAALDDFLDPLSGFEGGGWPFGRPVYLSELYEVIESVEGVDYVPDISVHARGETGREEGNVTIPDAALVAPETHSVFVRGGH